MSDTYHVVVTRSEGTWEADVPNVAGAHTFARSLPSLIKSVREVIILMDDLDDSADPAFELFFDVEDAALIRAVSIGQERRALQARIADVQAETEAMARILTKAGWSVRDVAVLLDITPGRVSQVAPTGHSDSGEGVVTAVDDKFDMEVWAVLEGERVPSEERVEMTQSVVVRQAGKAPVKRVVSTKGAGSKRVAAKKAVAKKATTYTTKAAAAKAAASGLTQSSRSGADKRR